MPHYYAHASWLSQQRDTIASRQDAVWIAFNARFLIGHRCADPQRATTLKMHNTNAPVSTEADRRNVYEMMAISQQQLLVLISACNKHERCFALAK